MVVIKTSLGEIKLELLEEEAPETVKNFLGYVDDGHYNGTIFHRVIDGFMIQGGGFDASFTQLPTKAPIRNEADNRVENKRGTVAMARTPDPHSASSQFFINVSDNDFLNYKSSTPDGYGYCVFARVVDGMDVVDKIKSVETGNRGAHGDVPVENVLIEEIVRVDS
jgi:peptidyl-prolyl cis-trans isomerase B (cyclophilin B)